MSQQVSDEFFPFHNPLRHFIPHLADDPGAVAWTIQPAILAADQPDCLAEVLLSFRKRDSLCIGTGQLKHIADVALWNRFKYQIPPSVS
jgi:hypothetical protein